MEVEEYKALIDATANIFNQSISHTVSESMRSALEQDIYVFSGLKTHAQLTTAKSWMSDENGIVPYYQFEQKILELNEAYNTNYLQAEYNYAVHTAQMAEKWDNFSDDTERYWLQFRTAGDDKVRDSHAELAGVTLPKDDPFWDKYTTPLDWGCRCVVVEVLARDYEKSDSAAARKKGDKATTRLDKDGNNKAEMFRFNPGKDKKIFPPGNNYEKFVGADKVKKEVLAKKEQKDIALLKESERFKQIKKAMDPKQIEAFTEIDETKKLAVNIYTRDDYEGINQFNRGLLKDASKKEYYKAMTRIINSTLDEISDKFQGDAYRGTFIDAKLANKYKKAFENNGFVTEKGFTSASYNETKAFDGNVIFKIKAKNVAKIEQISNIKTEQEVLFKTGQKFKVTNFKDEGNGRYYIEMVQD